MHAILPYMGGTGRGGGGPGHVTYGSAETAPSFSPLLKLDCFNRRHRQGPAFIVGSFRPPRRNKPHRHGCGSTPTSPGCVFWAGSRLLEATPRTVFAREAPMPTPPAPGFTPPRGLPGPRGGIYRTGTDAVLPRGRLVASLEPVAAAPRPPTQPLSCTSRALDMHAS